MEDIVEETDTLEDMEKYVHGKEGDYSEARELRSENTKYRGG
jgi:hypothetical protein